MQQKKIRAKKNQTSFEKKIRFERKKIVAFAKGRKFPYLPQTFFLCIFMQIENLR
jgi:hypothetical protein